MDQPGVKRRLGTALVISGVVLIVLGALCWARVIPVADERRTLLGAALLAAGLVDGVIGFMLRARSDA